MSRHIFSIFLSSLYWIRPIVLIVLAPLLGGTTIGHTQSSCSGDIASSDAVQIEFLGHASFRFTDDEGARIIIDPYRDYRWISYGFPQDLAVDRYVVTHPHYDHNAVPLEIADDDIISGVGDFEVGGIKVTGFAGRHARHYGRRFEHKNTIYVFERAGLRWMHVGDNGLISEEFADYIQPIHILFLPIEDEEHLLSFEEVETIRSRVKPRIIVPMHYRLDEYEPDPDRPDDLGNLSQFLSTEDTYSELETYCAETSIEGLPEGDTLWIFQPHPDIQR